MGNKNLCIIQARVGSTRLPGKVLKMVGEQTLLEREVDRVNLAKKIDKIVIATTINKEDDEIEILCQKIGLDCYRGSAEDVLERYYQCARQYSEYENIIRITGDCPLIDPIVIDQVIDFFTKNNFDYASNVNPVTFPDGLDIEVFKKDVLSRTNKEAEIFSDREHVTQYMRKDSKNKIGNFFNTKDYSNYRLTVDELEDLEVVKFIIKNSQPNASYLDYVNLLDKHLEIKNKNKHIARNEGLTKSLAKDKKI